MGVLKSCWTLRDANIPWNSRFHDFSNFFFSLPVYFTYGHGLFKSDYQVDLPRPTGAENQGIYLVEQLTISLAAETSRVLMTFCESCV
jgi:hypothetical protein